MTNLGRVFARQVREFRFVAYSFDSSTGRAEFTYSFDDTHSFVETFVFPVPKDWPSVSDERKAAVDRAIFLLSLVAGVVITRPQFHRLRLSNQAPLPSLSLNTSNSYSKRVWVNSHL